VLAVVGDDAVVLGDAVHDRYQAAPDLNRAAADRFGAAPHTCVAVEDSPDDTRSA
jgi:beta-phosphoglucomutase-like phosphatase (HAD superfamily)